MYERPWLTVVLWLTSHLSEENLSDFESDQSDCELSAVYALFYLIGQILRFCTDKWPAIRSNQACRYSMAYLMK